MRRFYSDDDDDNVVRDGETVRLSMLMLDEQQRAVAQAAQRVARIVDGLGNAAGHKPGYAFNADDTSEAQARANAAWEKRGELLSDAWRTPLLADTLGPIPLLSANNDTNDAAVLAARRDAAYAKRGEKLANAWKGGDQ